jgi:hypothetical protein
VRKFTRQQVLAVVRHHEVPEEYHEELIKLFAGPFNDRRFRAGSDKLRKKLGFLYLVVGSSFAYLRLLEGEGCASHRPRLSIIEELEAPL